MTYECSFTQSKTAIQKWLVAAVIDAKPYGFYSGYGA
jgi:hypothetical protein